MGAATGKPAVRGRVDPRLFGALVGIALFGIAFAMLGAAPAQGSTHAPAADDTQLVAETVQFDYQPAIEEDQLDNSPVLASSSSGLTEISGQIQFQHEHGHYEPARQVEVRILKDGVFNREITTTTTDDNGEYSAYIDVEDWTGWLSDELDIYVQAVAENPAADVITLSNSVNFDGNGVTYAERTSATVSEGASSKTVDLTITERDERRAFQIANAALEAYEFTEEEIGWTREQVTIDYPDTVGGNRYMSPIDTIVISEDGWTRKDHTVHHEYGHSFMGALFGYSGWELPGLETWLKNDEGKWFPCHVIYSKTDETYAWYEGFAQFFESAVRDDTRHGAYDINGTQFFTLDRTHPRCHNASGNEKFDGDEVEGAIASILWDLYDGTSQDHDDLDVDLEEIFGTVSAWDGVTSDHYQRNRDKALNIHDFWDQFRTDENHAALRTIFFYHGILKPDRFYPNNDIDSAAAIPTGQPVEAQLNYNDYDYFEFEVDDGDGITITVDRQLGNSNFNIHVYNPGGHLIHRNDGVGATTELTFEAETSGTHYVMINDDEPEVTAGIYEITIDGADPADLETDIRLDLGTDDDGEDLTWDDIRWDFALDFGDDD